jgi:uncharacterized protein
MSVFLRAEWRKLAMANYVIDPSILSPYVPAHTKLDFWNTKCYVSLVGFMFMNTRVKGFKIPYHVNFEEVNLRFYVQHLNSKNELRRGVVFIKEFVPKIALTFVANTIYGEHYQTVAMRHTWKNVSPLQQVEYKWNYKQWNSLQLTAEIKTLDIAPGSEAEFITEHYWGYTKLGPSKTSEYAVEHPRWKIHPVHRYEIDVNFAQLYGMEFESLNHQKPESVFLAEGSEILVRKGCVL